MPGKRDLACTMIGSQLQMTDIHFLFPNTALRSSQIPVQIVHKKNPLE